MFERANRQGAKFPAQSALPPGAGSPPTPPPPILIFPLIVKTAIVLSATADEKPEGLEIGFTTSQRLFKVHS
jgi:hypothetical protein